MLPLEGIKVVDLTQAEVGPRATMLLADMGADVIKIEPRQGEYTRPVTKMYDRDGLNAYFLAHNRNKRGIALDYTKPEGREIIIKLAKQADIFVHTYAPGVAERHGLDYDTIRKINPQIIYCSSSGFGKSGPMSSMRGFDLTAQAYAGMVRQNGPKDAEVETPIFTAIIDQCTSMHFAVGILLALRVREHTGMGQQVTTSLFGSAIWMQSMELISVVLSGKHPPKGDRGHSMVRGLYRTWRAKDGWMVTCSVKQVSWLDLCQVLNAPDLITDPRFIDEECRDKNRDEMLRTLDEKFVARTVSEWMPQLNEIGMICAPVHDYYKMLNDPLTKEQIEANEFMVKLDTKAGAVSIPGVPVKLSETPGIIRRGAPEIGEHNNEVLLELGYTPDEIALLKAKAVF